MESSDWHWQNLIENKYTILIGSKIFNKSHFTVLKIRYYES